MPVTSPVAATPLVGRPAVWAVAWVAVWVAARALLEQADWPPWTRILAALAPAPIAIVALLAIVRGARRLDELERRIQLEALSIAFVLAVLLLMTLGLMELAVALNPNDWSYRHVWAMLPALYFAGLAWSRRRYA